MSASLKIPDTVRAAWHPGRRIPVSEWAATERTLSRRESGTPGRWRRENAPYADGIMDAFSSPSIEEIVIVAAAQVVKTECLLNMLGWAVSQDPAPMLYVLPRDRDAASFFTGRVRDMFNSTPDLAKLLSTDWYKRPSGTEIQTDTMVIRAGSAHSPASLASHPCRYVLLDEVDKYPRFSGRESSPVSLATERAATYWDRKIVMASTPTTSSGYIWQAWLGTDRRTFRVPCPFCGAYQELGFANVKWPKDERDPEKILTHRLAWYECAKCEARIEESEKRRMILGGVWAPEGVQVTSSGKLRGKTVPTRRAGFRLTRLESLWTGWSDIAARFLRSKDYYDELMNFNNSWMAQPFDPKVSAIAPAHLASLVDDYDVLTAPAAAHWLTAGVDVQLDHFWIAVWAWGAKGEAWLVYSDRLGSWDDVHDAIFKTAYTTAGTETLLPLVRAGVDENYRMDEVLAFARARTPLVVPMRGGSAPAAVPWQTRMLDKPAKPGGKVHRGLSHTVHNPNYFKAMIQARLDLNPSDPGRWHLYKDCPPEVAEHLTAEQYVTEVDRKTGRLEGRWKVVPPNAPNHLLDCTVMACVAAEMSGARRIPSGGGNASSGSLSSRKREKGKGGGWIGGGERSSRKGGRSGSRRGGRGGWLK